MTESPLLELRGITKRFPGIVANDHVDFELAKGEVHALLGENGAGKSTLMNILYGLYHPDEGEVRLRGEPVRIDSPNAAIEHGIGMVHQHFMLIPVMTVAENIVLAVEPRKGPFLDIDAAEKSVREISQRFGLAVRPDARIESISVGMQQRVEILKALYRGAEILILDEPTAVLTPQEAEELFEIIRSLQAEGKSIIFITHKLGEVLAIADRITVLRRGKTIETVPREGATEEGLAKLMVGREVLLRVDKTPATPGDPLLEVEDLRVLDERGLEAVRGVSLDVRAGEIVGIAGVDGNGQSELVEAITGLRKAESGRVAAGGKDLTDENARDCMDAGVGHIPEDRQQARPRPRFHARREHRPQGLRRGAGLQVGLALPEAPHRARAQAPDGVRRSRRRPAHTRGLSLRRQPAEGRHRARGLARPAHPRRRAAHPRARRGRDRVRAPTPRRGARRRARDPPRLLRAGRDPLALRPDPRPLRRTHRRRVHARRLRGGARHRHDRRAQRAGGGRVTEPPAAQPPPPAPAEPPEGSVTGLQSFYDRAGGALVPVAAAFLAFLIGGLVVAITEKSITAPFEAYKAIFQGTGLTWFIPGIGDTAEEARDLQQTLLIMTPLVLTALAVAFAFRCGMFNIGGQGQYWVGLLTAIYVGTHLDGTPRVLHIIIAIFAALLAGAVWGGIAGILKATTGAHEVITTIMLNWIAIWVGKWLLEAPDGFLQGADPSLPRSDDVLASAQLPEIWGAPAAAARGHLHRALRADRLPPAAQPDDARLRGARGRLQPRRGRVRRDLRQAQLLPGARHLRLLRGARRGDRHARVEVPADEHGVRRELLRLHGHRRRAPGAQQGDRHPLLRAPLRVADRGHLAAPARS